MSNDLNKDEPLVIRENPFDKWEIVISGRGRAKFATVSKFDAAKLDDKGQEIADLIVRAVNSYEANIARIEVLEAALRDIADTLDESCREGSMERNLGDKASAALAGERGRNE